MVSQCPLLTSLPDLPDHIQQLALDDCSGLIRMPNLPGALTYLRIKNCPGLTDLPALIGWSKNSAVDHDLRIMSIGPSHGNLMIDVR